VQLPPPVEVMRTADADTAPLLADVPDAVTQSPTARPDAAAGSLWEYVVAEFTLTSNFFALGVDFDFDFDLDDFEKAAEEKPDTVICFPFTLVTLPAAKAMLFVPGRPCPAPRPGKLPPPWGNRLEFVPPGAPRYPPMPVQLPDDDAVVMDTVFAVMAPLLDLVPVAVTQSPLTTDDADTVAIWLNVVEELHDTVV
jgi:hypothetical protein